MQEFTTRRVTEPAQGVAQFATVEFALIEKLPTAIGSNAVMRPGNTGSKLPLLSGRGTELARTHTDLRISTAMRGIFKNKIDASRLDSSKFHLELKYLIRKFDVEFFFVTFERAARIRCN